MLWVRTLGLAQSWVTSCLVPQDRPALAPGAPSPRKPSLAKAGLRGPLGEGEQAQWECQNGPGDRETKALALRPEHKVRAEWAMAWGGQRTSQKLVGRCHRAPGPQCGLSFRPEHRETLQGFREVAPAQSHSERIPHCSSEDRIEEEGTWETRREASWSLGGEVRLCGSRCP